MGGCLYNTTATNTAIITVQYYKNTRICKYQYCLSNIYTTKNDTFQKLLK